MILTYEKSIKKNKNFLRIFIVPPSKYIHIDWNVETLQLVTVLLILISSPACLAAACAHFTYSIQPNYWLNHLVCVMESHLRHSDLSYPWSWLETLSSASLDTSLKISIASRWNISRLAAPKESWETTAEPCYWTGTSAKYTGHRNPVDGGEESRPESESERALYKSSSKFEDPADIYARLASNCSQHFNVYKIFMILNTEYYTEYHFFCSNSKRVCFST